MEVELELALATSLMLLTLIIGTCCCYATKLKKERLLRTPDPQVAKLTCMAHTLNRHSSQISSLRSPTTYHDASSDFPTPLTCAEV